MAIHDLTALREKEDAMPVYKVKINDQIYEVEVPNPTDRPVHVTVNGDPLEVWVEEPAGEKAQVLPISTAVQIPAPAAPPQPITKAQPTAGTGAITAPLPGVVTVISAQIGDTIEPGQELCILEAMKMNNPIRATVHGTVKAIHVRVGQQVQHGAPLFTIGD